MASPYTNGFGGDVNTAKDSRLDDDSPTLNYGTTTIWYPGSGANFYRCLFYFSLAGIPAGSTCDTAKMTLYHAGAAGAAAQTITFYKLLAENGGWIEGTKNGATAGAGEPCWNAKEADGAGGVTTAWHGSAGCSTSGEDYDATAIGHFHYNTGDVAGTPYEFDLDLATVESWFGDDDANFGIIGARADAASDWDNFALSDHATTGYRPKLVVEYTEEGGGVEVITTTVTVPDDCI